MNSVSIIKVQKSVLEDLPAKEIVGPLVGSTFTHLAVPSPGSLPDEFAGVLEEAGRHGLGVLWWYAIGWMEVVGLPERCDVRAVWPEAPRSWVNFELDESRQGIADGAREVLSRFPDLSGILVDYCRYGHGWDARSGGRLSASQVTRAMRDLRDAAPGTRLVANVFDWPLAAAKYAQNWDTWVKDGLVDGVSARHYDRPEDLSIVIPDGVSVGEMGICMAVGGTRDFDALSEAEVKQYLEIAAREGFENPSVFDWPNVDRLGYWHLFRAAGPGVTSYEFNLRVLGLSLSGTVDVRRVERRHRPLRGSTGSSCT